MGKKITAQLKPADIEQINENWHDIAKDITDLENKIESLELSRSKQGERASTQNNRIDSLEIRCGDVRHRFDEFMRTYAENSRAYARSEITKAGWELFQFILVAWGLFYIGYWIYKHLTVGFVI